MKFIESQSFANIRQSQGGWRPESGKRKRHPSSEGRAFLLSESGKAVAFCPAKKLESLYAPRDLIVSEARQRKAARGVGKNF
jgi:hypothetical protein